ncbi:VOC family protein [Streptomyces sp. NPDC088915]|uniref:VOC family protein n=1 Tax=Streptomyces sp. NPDC088915 TaxID=3365912 RepID=UPI00381B8676
MAVDLSAGVPMGDCTAALSWYERLFGTPPAFLPNDTESVRELGERRCVCIEQLPGRAGNALHTLFDDDLDARVAGITGRGLKPAARETYANGVRKVTYEYRDGNRIGFGGGPGNG